MITFLSSVSRNPITCLGDDLSDFIKKGPFSSHLRDIKTNQYILCNEYSKENIGLKSTKDIIGLKPRDVIEHRAWSEREFGYLETWNRKLQNLLDKTYELSNRILIERVPAIQRDVELSFNGFIRITQTIRSPIFDSKKKIVAIASVDYDFSQQCELLYLFKLYASYLPPKKAIENFLKYLNFFHHFAELPTCKELTALLLMRQNPSVEYVSTHLNVSKRTIQEYKNNLSRKLLGIDLTQLLINLRIRNENNFITWG